MDKRLYLYVKSDGKSDCFWASSYQEMREKLKGVSYKELYVEDAACFTFRRLNHMPLLENLK